MLLNLLIWVIIAVVVVCAVKILAGVFELPPPIIKLVLMVIGAVLLIALLIMVWPFLTNPGMHHWQP